MMFHLACSKVPEVEEEEEEEEEEDSEEDDSASATAESRQQFTSIVQHLSASLCNFLQVCTIFRETQHVCLASPQAM